MYAANTPTPLVEVNTTTRILVFKTLNIPTTVECPRRMCTQMKMRSPSVTSFQKKKNIGKLFLSSGACPFLHSTTVATITKHRFKALSTVVHRVKQCAVVYILQGSIPASHSIFSSSITYHTSNAVHKLHDKISPNTFLRTGAVTSNFQSHPRGESYQKEFTKSRRDYYARPSFTLPLKGNRIVLPCVSGLVFSGRIATHIKIAFRCDRKPSLYDVNT